MNKKRDTPPRNNPVAKNAHKFNKAVVFKSRKAYTRKPRTPPRDGADRHVLVA